MKTKRGILFSAIVLLCVSILNAQTFQEVPAGFTGYDTGSAEWGDFNNDGYPDLILTGSDGTGTAATSLYSNNGDGSFTLLSGTNLPGYQYSGVKWSDVNNDGFLDLFISGELASGTNSSELYINNKDSSFTVLPGNQFAGMTYSAVDIKDYDHDGDLDILVNGISDTDFENLIYENIDGTSFELDPAYNADGYIYGTALWGDYDADADMDILITGLSFAGSLVSHTDIYRNEGSIIPEYVRQNQGLPGRGYGLSDWGDYNSDGLLDILLAGFGTMTVYKNNGENSFSDQLFGFPNASDKSAIWSDVNNDGYLDIISSGSNSTEIYINSRVNSFDELLSTPFINPTYAAIATSDYDRDGDLDIVLTGQVGSVKHAKLYKNNTAIANTQPSPPENLYSSITDSTVILSWDKALDNETPQDGLSYNVSVKNIAGEIIVNSHTLPGQHVRTVYERGNAGHNTRYILSNLPCGEYHWSVQTIDNNFEGSVFATEQSFIYIPPPAALSVNDTGVTKVTLAWESPCSIFEVAYGPAGFAIHDGAIVNNCSNPVSLAQLTPETEYQFYVRDSCGPGITSEWIGPGSFTTKQLFNDDIPILTEIFYSDALWVDTDNDNDLDVAITGTNYGTPTSTLFRNDGGGTFTEVATGWIDVEDGSIAAADFNNDNLVDFVISGIDDADQKVAHIYINQGGNIFSESPTSITPVIMSDISCADFDQDGDIDILLSGLSDEDITLEMYVNLGNATFEVRDVSLRECQHGFVKVFDFNNDGYPDVFIKGRDKNGNYHATLYKNNGDMTFTDTEQEFSVSNTCDVGDYDNDGDPDLLFERKIYRNNGDETFTLVEPTYEFEDTGSSTWIDADNDGDLDLVFSSLDIIKTIIYFNDGMGNYTLSDYEYDLYLNFTYDKGDFDQDNDLDLLLTGFYNEEIPYCRIFVNQMDEWNRYPDQPENLTVSILGQKEVTLSWDQASDEETPAEALNYAVKIGTTSGGYEIANPLTSAAGIAGRIPTYTNSNQAEKYIINDLPIGTYSARVQTIDNGFERSLFSSALEIEIKNLFEKSRSYADLLGSLKWCDHNNNGKYEFLATGKWNGNDQTTICSLQEISYTFSILKTDGGLSDFTDYNNDGYIDLFTSYYDPADGFSTELNRNTSELSNGFHIYEVVESPFPQYNIYSTSWGDYNNDGFVDLLAYFRTDDSHYLCSYKNMGDGTFDEAADTIFFTQLYNPPGGAAEWIDYDNDFDLDIMLAADSVYLFENTDNGFMQTALPVAQMTSTKFEWADLDNDQKLDLIMTGRTNAGNTTKIYKNEGSAQFTEVETGIRQVDGRAVTGDYNNDGLSDIFIYGNSGDVVTFIYKNLGNFQFGQNTFTEVDINDNIGASDIWCDYDNDGDLDFVINGDPGFTEPEILDFYINNGDWPNNPPGAPDNLQTYRHEYGIVFSWNEADDPESAEGGLSYSIRLGTTPGGFDLIAPLSNFENGFNRVPQMGNCLTNTGWRIDSLQEGTYYWSVQAIDQAFAGGEWADEQSFTVSVVRADFEADTVCLGMEMNFTDLTLTSGEAITEWKWNFGDGNNSTEQNPKHVYQSAGTYDVELVALTPQYSDTITKSVIVKPIPVAGFTADVVCQGEATIFLNTTEKNDLVISEWYWDFGDGGSSSEENPGSHGYINSGNYPASLITVAENGCSDTLIQNAVVGSFPSKSVSVDGLLSFCSGGNVKITAEANENFNYQWRLNEENITDANSNHYSATISGIYTAEIINPTGNCTTLSDETTIVVNESPNSPGITTSGPTTFCSNEEVTLSVTDNPEYSYSWKHNNGEIGTDSSKLTVNLSGTYTLVVTNKYNCTVNAANEVTINVNPMPVMPTISSNRDPYFCDGEAVKLSVTQNSSYNYQWKRDGNIITDSVANAIWANASGDYSLYISTDEGCALETPPKEVLVYENPDIPVISATGPTTFCSNDEVTLSVNHNVDYSYNWKDDNGDIVNDSSKLTVNATGTYTLVVTNENNCAVNASNEVTISVNPMPALPTISTNRDPFFCDGETIKLSVPNNSSYNYQWKKDGNIMSDSVSNAILANTSGNYSLYISTDEGCALETSPKEVLVYENPLIPVISASGPTTFCSGEEITLSVTDNPYYTYRWKHNNGDIGTDTSKLTVNTSGKYILIVINGNDCIANADNEVVVKVNSMPVKPAISNIGDTTLCEGEFVVLTVNADDDYEYHWLRNENLISGANSSKYTATESGSYTLQISTLEGCAVETEPKEVTVNDAPDSPTISTTLGETDLLNLCNGDSVMLNLDAYPGLEYSWYRGEDQTVGSNRNVLTVKADGSYTAVVINEYDCTTESANEIITHFNQAPKTPILSRSGDLIICEGDTTYITVKKSYIDLTYNWIFDGQPTGTDSDRILLDENGTYHVEVSNQYNCYESSDTLHVEIIDTEYAPALTFTSGSESACPDETIILGLHSINESLLYSMQPANTVLSDDNHYRMKIVDEGVYWVTAQAGECVMQSDQVEVSFKPTLPKPEISAIGPNYWYLAVSNDSAGMYRWYLDGVLQEESNNHVYVAGEQLGKYYAEISSDGDCYIRSDVISIPENIVLGATDAIDPWENLKIYPNPTPGLFTLEMDNPIMGELIIDIFGETGARIINIKFHKELNHFKTEIDLSDQPAAIYLIGLELDKYRTTRSLIVE